MTPNTWIGIVPEGGYRRAEKQSIIALKWLKYLATTQNLQLKHKLNGGEQRIGRYKVDGYDPTTNTAYEFNGCWCLVFVLYLIYK